MAAGSPIIGHRLDRGMHNGTRTEVQSPSRIYAELFYELFYRADHNDVFGRENAHLSINPSQAPVEWPTSTLAACMRIVGRG